MKVKNLNPVYRVFDKFLFPIMFILRGFKFNNIQETHPWHIQYIDADYIDFSLCAEIVGQDNSKQKKTNFLFHAPLFGGWKNYCFLKINTATPIWHVGWIVKGNERGEIQKLNIYDNKIKVLTGPKNSNYYAFAIDKFGKQIPIEIVSYGDINDGKFKNIRIF